MKRTVFRKGCKEKQKYKIDLRKMERNERTESPDSTVSLLFETESSEMSW